MVDDRTEDQQPGYNHNFPLFLFPLRLLLDKTVVRDSVYYFDIPAEDPLVYLPAVTRFGRLQLLVSGGVALPTSSRAMLPNSDDAGRCDEVVPVDHPFDEGGL